MRLPPFTIVGGAHEKQRGNTLCVQENCVRMARTHQQEVQNMTHYLIIGNGVAGTTAAEEIRKRDREGAITIVTDEPFPFYWRLQLNEYISGDLPEERLYARKQEWYKEQGIEKAVIGGFDPSARKFMKTDELTFTVPWSLYKKMLAALPESMFNVDGEWPAVRKKVARSAKAWGEED